MAAAPSRPLLLQPEEEAGPSAEGRLTMSEDEFEVTKAAVRERDGHPRCVHCGMSDPEHRSRYGRGLHVLGQQAVCDRFVRMMRELARRPRGK
jgi:hypothetical protein